MDQIETVHIRIEGRVQGVGYRAWVEMTARNMGITGWVRNRRDRSVEAVLQGTSDRIAAMLRDCEHGPPDAIVGKIEILGRGSGAYGNFEVRPTA